MFITHSYIYMFVYLAILFPDTSGLDQWLEESSYWYQHYLILTVPIYLLCRDNFLVLKLSSYRTTIYGLWLLALSHFGFYEVGAQAV